MRINMSRFLWAPLSVLMVGFPVLAKAGPLKASPISGKTAASVVLVDDDHHRGDHDRGRWGRERDRGLHRGWDRDDYRWRGRRHRRDWDDYYGRNYYYYPYGYSYYGYPYNNYGYYPGYYPYYPSYRRGNIIGGFLRFW